MGFARLILAMKRCPRFVVTRVQGKAVGGGIGLIAASDYVLALDVVSFRLAGPRRVDVWFCPISPLMP